jgi:hypothetical protein
MLKAQGGPSDAQSEGKVYMHYMLYLLQRAFDTGATSKPSTGVCEMHSKTKQSTGDGDGNLCS